MLWTYTNIGEHLKKNYAHGMWLKTSLNTHVEHISIATMSMKAKSHFCEKAIRIFGREELF